MWPINLPHAALRLKQEEGKTLVFDICRKKWLVLAPEEWVRQHWLHELTGRLGYPAGLIKAEGSHKYNRLRKRSDILCYGPEGRPLLLAECKAPDVPINNAVFRQAVLYNKTIKAPCLLLTNGLKHFCALAEPAGTYKFIDAVPAYQELCRMAETLRQEAELYIPPPPLDF